MASRVLLSTPELTLGEFACAPGEPLWEEVNTNIGPRPHVVFPRTQVLIAQEGAPPVLATPNVVVYYKPHQRYRRAIRDARGDHCLWLEARPDLLGRPPAGPAAPSDPRAYLLAVALARHLRAERAPDRLLAEEGALRLLDAALPADPARGAAARRDRTRRDHAELAAAAQALLAARMTEPLSLAAIGAALAVSPFHLARVFRVQTGFTLSGYVHGLRLRRAAELLAADPAVDLSRLAVDLGYCSPSHFTDRFRSAFGRPPSAVRGAQLRTIVEAARPVPA